MTREEFNSKVDEILAKQNQNGTGATVAALQELIKQLRDTQLREEIIE